MDARKPDWGRWTSQASARAWECLALSVDIEPRELGVDHFLVLRSCESGASMASEKDPEWLLQMCGRLTELTETLADAPSGLRAGRSKLVGMEAELKLKGFVDWACSRKWAVPDALAALATGEGNKADEEAGAQAKSKAQSKAGTKKASPKASAKSGKSGTARKAAAKKPSQGKAKSKTKR